MVMKFVWVSPSGAPKLLNNFFPIRAKSSLKLICYGRYNFLPVIYIFVPLSLTLAGKSLITKMEHSWCTCVFHFLKNQLKMD